MQYARLHQLASRVQAVISDVDGVLTDNRVLVAGPHHSKWRSYYDGQGVSLLRAAGIRVCLITNESGDSAQHIVDVVHKWNTLPSSSCEEGDGGWPHVVLFAGVGGEGKVVSAKRWLTGIGVPIQACAFMGDDMVDTQLLQEVGLSAAPISADPYIKEIVSFVSERPGGYGAFRDLANFILKAKGLNPLNLKAQ